jgi:phosphoribosylanthranilate isomerase
MSAREPLAIKICGLTTEEAVTACLDASVDMLGFVFFPKSPRNVLIERARALAAPARGRAEIVALAVNPTDEAIRAIAEGLKPDLIQLHGQEDLSRCAVIKALTGTPIMKALSIAGAADVAAARAIACGVDRLLFDAKPPADPSALPGGNGLTFDWRLVADLDPPLDFMLSGGLTVETVADAVRLVRPWAIDVSSGVEARPGLKDPARIAAFVANARAAATMLEQPIAKRA